MNNIPDMTPKPKEEVKYVFPKLDKQAALLMDPDHNVAWLGIPLGEMDYLEAQAILDDSKYKLFSWYKQRQAKKLIQPFEAANSMKNFLMRKFK